MALLRAEMSREEAAALAGHIKFMPGVTRLSSFEDMSIGKFVVQFDHGGKTHRFDDPIKLSDWVQKLVQETVKANADPEADLPLEPDWAIKQKAEGFEKDLAEKQHAAMMRAREHGMDKLDEAAELAFANKQALNNAERHGEPTPLDKLAEADPDAYDVQKTVNKHRAKDEAFELGAVEVIDVSDDVEIKENERAVKVVVEAYGFTVSEIIVGPKDGDHMPLCVDLIEKQTHRLFTAIDALRARNIRIR